MAHFLGSSGIRETLIPQSIASKAVKFSKPDCVLIPIDAELDNASSPSTNTVPLSTLFELPTATQASPTVSLMS